MPPTRERVSVVLKWGFEGSWDTSGTSWDTSWGTTVGADDTDVSTTAECRSNTSPITVGEAVRAADASPSMATIRATDTVCGFVVSSRALGQVKAGIPAWGMYMLRTDCLADCLLILVV